MNTLKKPNSGRIHLEKLHTLVGEFDQESGDVVIGKMLPELGSLIVKLSEELDSSQRKVLNLTWGLFGLTIALALIATGQLFYAVHPPQMQVVQSIPQSVQVIPVKKPLSTKK